MRMDEFDNLTEAEEKRIMAEGKEAEKKLWILIAVLSAICALI